MITLQLLGGAVLLGETGPISGPAAQRRRVALLSLLAASPANGVSRDKLIAYFWPEEDRERARHFLADSVFMLRKHLGKESILTVGDDLVLNADVVGCDARAFRDAVAANEWERAVELYRGPFMDGFFVSDAPEFEQWVERERGKFAQLQADALEKLATAAEGMGSPEKAVEWWKRLAAHEPLSSRVAMRLMAALASTGDRGAALMHARVHAALLREVLDTDPDAEVEALAARISSQPESDARPRVLPTPAAPRVVPASPLSVREVEPTSLELSPASGPAAAAAGGVGTSASGPVAAVEGVGASPSGPVGAVEGVAVFRAGPDTATAEGIAASTSTVASRDEGVPRRWSSRRRQLALLALIPAVFVALAIWSGERNAIPAVPAEPTPAARASIAVLPFRVHGSPEIAYLGLGMVMLLSTQLDVPGLLRPVDTNLLLSRKEELVGDAALSMEQEQELARSFSAQLFLTGEVVEADGNLSIVVTLYRPGEPPELVLRTSAEGTDLFVLVSQLSRDILVGQLGEPGDRLSQFAIRTTSSAPALKSYIAGEQAFRAADYARAADSFRAAVQADPSFALAHYRLSMAAEWSFDFDEARQEAEEALESIQALSGRYQRLVRGWYNFIAGKAEEAEAIYEGLLAEDPSDVEAWAGLGEVRVHYNPVRGLPSDAAIPAFERVLGLAPDYGEVRFHMLEFDARDGEIVRFDSLLAGVDPESPQRLSWEAARAASWGSEAEKAAAARRLADAEEVVIGIAVARTGVHFRDLEAAGDLANILTESRRPAGWRAAGHIMAAQTYLARGERDLAERQLEAAAQFAPAWAMEMRALAELLPGSGASPERLRQLRDELEAWDPGRTAPELTFFFATHADVHAQLRLYMLALISVALGEDGQAATFRRDLAAAGRTSEGRDFARSLALSVDAHRARARGDLADALEILERDDFTPPLERIAVSPFFARSLDRYLRAEVLRDLNRPAEALAWYRSLWDGTDVLLWPAAARRLSELGEPVPTGRVMPGTP